MKNTDEILDFVYDALENGNDVYLVNSDSYSRNTKAITDRKREFPTDIFITPQALELCRNGQFSSELQVCHVGLVGENTVTDIQIGDITLVEFNSNEAEIAVIDTKNKNKYWEKFGVGLSQIEKRVKLIDLGLPLVAHGVVRLSKGIPPSLKTATINLANRTNFDRIRRDWR